MCRVYQRVSILVLGCAFLTLLTNCTGTASEAPPANEPEAGDPLADRVGTGTARVTGTIRSADPDDPLPLGGVLVILGDAVSHSNVDGTFVILGVRAGRNKFFVDASEVQARDGHYGQFFADLEIQDGQDRNFDRPIYLPFVPNSAEQTIAAAEASRIVTDDGIVLDIPAGGARMAGREYEGPIAVLSAAPELSPLPWPARFDGRIVTAVTIQPAGLEFPVPISISFPIGDRAINEGDLKLLWSLSGDGPAAKNVGVAVRQVDQVVSLAGGLRSGGWHVLTGMEFSVREPCLGGDASEAASCLAGAAGLLEDVRSAVGLERAGAAATLTQLLAMFQQPKRTAEQAQSILDASRDLFSTARDALSEYRRVYEQLGDSVALRAALDSVRFACAPVNGCRSTSLERSNIESELDVQLTALSDNVASYAALFDRLAASIRTLDSFYVSDQLLDDTEAAGFSSAADEFVSAYDAFDQGSSPVTAYDNLVAVLGEVEDQARGLVNAVSADPDAAESPAVLMHVCDNLGATQFVPVADGIAPLSDERETTPNSGDCLIVAMNPGRGLTSIPIRDDRLAGTIYPPVLLPLMASIASRATSFEQPVSGQLTEAAPVHQWSFAPTKRTGLHVHFVAEGDALAGYAPGNGAVQIAHDGGFDVFNVPEENGASVLVFGEDIPPGGEVPYRFSVEENPVLFDFGSLVNGTFDVDTRAAAILFDGQIDQQILLERSCCDSLGTSFSHYVLGPDGAKVPRIDSTVPEEGISSELFSLQESGLHRVLVTPFAGQFADYEFAIRPIPSIPPVEYELGTTTEATFNSPGETVSFTFVAAGGTLLTVEGLSSTGPDPVRLSLIGPEEEVVAQGESLFLDGSTFSMRTFALPVDGTYTLSFRDPLNAVPATGSIAFRADIGGP